MEWHIRHELVTPGMPWSVFINQDKLDIYEAGFRTWQEANRYVMQRMQEEGGANDDTVQEASDESFPASDPPAWTKTTTR